MVRRCRGVSAGAARTVGVGGQVLEQHLHDVPLGQREELLPGHRLRRRGVAVHEQPHLLRPTGSTPDYHQPWVCARMRLGYDQSPHRSKRSS